MPTLSLSGELTALIRDMREIPGETSREMGTTMKRSADVVLREAKNRASWSSRIPGALMTRVTARSAARPGVDIIGRVGQAPHLRLYEGLAGKGRKKTFRHPLYGNREYWYSQATRPFIIPAVAATRPQFRKDVEDAALAAYRKAGFK